MDGQRKTTQITEVREMQVKWSNKIKRLNFEIEMTFFRERFLDFQKFEIRSFIISKFNLIMTMNPVKI